MKERDDNYHVQIKPALLFNLNRKFKSVYTPWVYTYLKLDCNNFIYKAPNKFYKINRREICDFFNVHSSTITRAFSELIKNGLMIKQNQEYKLLNDLQNSTFPAIEGLLEFVQINNNFFIDIVQRLNEVCGDNDSKDRSLVKALSIFYYLITKNRNAVVDEPILVSDETAKSISKTLNHDENYVKDYLEILETIGNIEIDEGIIKTVYACGTCQPFKKNIVNKPYKSFNYKKEDIEETELVPHVDIDTTITESAVEAVISKEPELEPVTDNERIKYILMMSNGNREKLISLLDQSNINHDTIRSYRDTHPEEFEIYTQNVA